MFFFFFQAEDGIRDAQESRGLGDVYKRQRPLNPQTRYGFSTKLSDYLISGVPVLVTDVSDNSIYIRDGINGYLIPPGSMSALEAKLMEIIDNYNQSSILIARNALETAARELDYRNYTDKLIDFLFKPTGTAYKLI